MNKTNPTHLNSVFEIDIWIDDNYSDDHILEIVAYPMAIVKHHGNGEEAVKIDTNHMVASLHLPTARLARNEKEFRVLMGHVGWTTIGIAAEYWSPEDVTILFGRALGACVMKVLVDACRNEFSGKDTHGVRYRAAGTSGRRGIQLCQALASNLKTHPDRSRSIPVHNQREHVAPASVLWGNPEDHWTNTAAR